MGQSPPPLAPPGHNARHHGRHCGARAGLFMLVGLGLLSFALLTREMASFQRIQSALSSKSSLLRSRAAARARVWPPKYMLVRAIGNALPPRHDPTRTLRNLRFTLEHEQLQDPELATHWVLNRLVDATMAQQVRELLQEFGANFTELSFELDAYARAPFHVVVEDQGADAVHSPNSPGDDAWARLQRVNDMYGAKNRYVMGINGARNVMLDIARRSGARWLLPWDQTCFLTQEAWSQMKRDLDAAANNQSTKYLVSYMDRLTQENDVILSPEFTPTPWEEPQLIFRSDALERFDEQLRYGKRDKAALLIRLRLSGPWDAWGWSSWEVSRTYANVSKDVVGPDAVPSTGYVIRLYSGLPAEIEVNNAPAGMWREMRRAEGVIAFLDKLEDRVMREYFAFDPNRLQVYNQSLLRQYKQQMQSNTSMKQNEMVAMVLADAELAMEVKEPFTVAMNGALGPSQDPQVFANFYDHQMDDIIPDDGQLVQGMAYNTTALALAWHLTGDERYAMQAAAFLRAWCVDEATSMRASLEFADMSFKKLLTAENGFVRGSPSGIRHLAVLPMLLDAVRLLKTPVSDSEVQDPVVSDGLLSGVETWARQLFDKFRMGYALDTFRASPDLFALQYDLQTVALAAFLNDAVGLRYVLGTMQGRIMTMLSREEKLQIPTGIASRPYTLLVLATWISAVDMAQQFDLARHLFHFDLSRTQREERSNPDGGLLCRFVGHSVPCCHAETRQQSTFDSSKRCVATLQSASEPELFVYVRLARQAVEHCPILAKRPMCSSLARVELSHEGLSASSLRRFSLPPYPFLMTSV